MDSLWITPTFPQFIFFWRSFLQSVTVEKRGPWPRDCRNAVVKCRPSCLIHNMQRYQSIIWFWGAIFFFNPPQDQQVICRRWKRGSFGIVHTSCKETEPLFHALFCAALVYNKGHRKQVCARDHTSKDRHSGPLRLRVQSRSRRQSTIMTSIAFSLRLLVFKEFQTLLSITSLSRD